ncbi:3-oxoacyl-[acyl-carrier-protein] synthase III C-terminal domain-containing protein [Actinomadura sp. GTD37]|uniref:3-oxoacyl-[acyl-carrier-protein] synthase III C-terminal domain-containing protein n=1 Tax=Actinomadura sp. GTD37 TaxID=1778030 RepID=UPI0035C09BCD
MTPPVDFGVAGIAAELGLVRDVADEAAGYVDDPERVLRWGYRGFREAPAGTTPTDLAEAAAVRALEDAGCGVDDLDLIVLADSDVPGYPHWDASAALARALGARGTPTLMLSQACASGVTGFGNVAGALAIQPHAGTVLLAAVNQVSGAHRNRMRTSTCLGSDGAVAAVLRRGHGRLRWLCTEQITEPEFCDFYRAEYGGSRAPFPPPGRSNTDVTVTERVQEHFDRDPIKLMGFVDRLYGRVAEVIGRACRRAGTDPARIARLIYINDNQQSMREVAAAVGIPPERTNAALAAELGHLGAADHLVCLKEHLERGELADGDLVALAGVSAGMHWFCTLVTV